MTILEFILAAPDRRSDRRGRSDHRRLLARPVCWCRSDRLIGAMLGSWIARRIGLPDLFVIQIDRWRSGAVVGDRATLLWRRSVC